MIAIRISASPNVSLDVAIERLSDGAFFDFNTGAFVPMTTANANFHLALDQSSAWPGRYAATVAKQQPKQFGVATAYAFWFCYKTGMTSPTRSAYAMHSTNPNALPWTAIGHEHAIFITEPGS